VYIDSDIEVHMIQICILTNLYYSLIEMAAVFCIWSETFVEVVYGDCP